MTYPDRGGYSPHAATGGIDAEAERLESQARLSWEAERDLIAPLLDRGARILEIGCGTGAMTRRLAAEWPGAAITALEPDMDLLAHARRETGCLAPQVTFAAGSIACNDLSDAGFDLAIVRYVLQHLDDPVAAMRSVAAKLAPGGRVLVIDVDAALWGIAEPHDPTLAGIHAAAGRWSRGGDRTIGRRLGAILGRAGYADCRLRTFSYDSSRSGVADFAAQLDPARILGAVTAGHIQFADFLRLRAAHARFLADPDAFVLMIGFAATGTVAPDDRHRDPPPADPG